MWLTVCQMGHDFLLIIVTGAVKVFKSHLYIEKNRFSQKIDFLKIKKKICKSWGKKKVDKEKGVRQVTIVQVCSFSTAKSGCVLQFQEISSLSSGRLYPYCDKFAPQTGLMEEVRVGTSQDFILWWGHIIGQNWSSFYPTNSDEQNCWGSSVPARQFSEM